MEAPLVRGIPVTAIDLWETGQPEINYDLVAANISRDTALDAARPDWRERYRCDWEVATGADHARFIRAKTGS